MREMDARRARTRGRRRDAPFRQGRDGLPEMAGGAGQAWMIILMRSFEQRVFYPTLQPGKSRQAAGRDAEAAPSHRRRRHRRPTRSGSEPHGHPQHTFLDVAGQRLMRLADNGPCSPASRTSRPSGPDLGRGRGLDRAARPPPAGGLLPSGNAHRRQHAAEAHQLPDEVRHRRRHLCAAGRQRRCATSCASPTKAAPSGSPTTWTR